MRRWLSWALVLGATALVPATARAGSADPVTVKSDALFEQGTKAYSSEKFDDAETFFRRAWALKKTHDTAANLGLTLMKLGRPTEAAGFLDYALHNSPPTDSDRAREQVKKRLDEAKSKTLTVRVAVNVDGADLTIDDKPAGAVPPWGTVYVDAGHHVVVARAAGYQAATQQVGGTAGGTVDARFELVAIKGGPSTAILVSGALLAAAGIGAGVAFTVVSSGAGKDRRAEIDSLAGFSPCGEGSPYPDQCADIRDKSATEQTFRTLSIVAFAAGGAALVGTVVYGVAKRNSKPATTGASVTPFVAPKTAGLFLKGAF